LKVDLERAVWEEVLQELVEEVQNEVQDEVLQDGQVTDVY
jgi:ribosome-binding factor A